METPDFEHGRVYFKQFGAERVKVPFIIIQTVFHIFAEIVLNLLAADLLYVGKVYKIMVFALKMSGNYCETMQDRWMYCCDIEL